MIFASDNWAGASEKVLAALVEAAREGGPAYGSDRLTRAAEARFAEIFERDVSVFLVSSGTAANALALSAYARPGGFIMAHRDAHILVDEAGAVEFFSGGNRIVGIEAVAGKLESDKLAAALADDPERSLHRGQPVAVSLAQVTEWGAVYRPDEIAALTALAREAGIAVHMDGARFAGAVAALGVSPAEVTWRVGVDVLTFGGTKNGCLAAEAVIFFDPSRAGDFAFARQRAGQGHSKNWFIAAQFLAYLEAGHWLDLARHANRMASELAEVLAGSASARLLMPPEANEVFAILPRQTDAHLRAAGATYYGWSSADLPVGPQLAEDEAVYRFVTSFQTGRGEIEKLAALL